MKAPPFFLGAAALFWGVQTGHHGAGIFMAFALELAGRVAFRLELSRGDFNNISDLCALMFAGIAVYAYATEDAAEAIMKIFRWIPLVFFPLIGAQLYSARGKIDLSAFFLFLRRQAEREGFRWELDLSFPFAAQCVLSAGGANGRGGGFFAGAALLAAWGLWGAKPRRNSRWTWAALFAMAAASGFAGQESLSRLERALERQAAGFAYRLARARTDPNRAFTALGHAGRLKMSDRIVLRVRTRGGEAPPPLLHEASYDTYHSFQWFVHAPKFEPAARGGEEGSWVLSPGAAAEPEFEVSAFLKKGSGVLPLPRFAAAVEGIPAAEVALGGLGTVKVSDGPPYLDYGVRSGSAARPLAPMKPGTAGLPPRQAGRPLAPMKPGTAGLPPRQAAIEAPPSPADAAVPAAERDLLSATAARLGLSAERPADSAAAVARFFSGFEYSIYRDARRPAEGVLEDFLLVSRSGHCEYFATATVLLLRAAGIPARYATGYAVREFSRLENAYVVRGRHAHAWARVRIGGVWTDLDTTPAAWAEIEERRASVLRPVADLFAWAFDRFNRWRWSRPEEGSKRTVVLVLLAILAFPLWRVVSGLRPARAAAAAPGSAPARARPGADSELYEIERALSGEGLGRGVSEPVPFWIARLEKTASVGRRAGPLRAIANLHARYRFDPAGLTRAERDRLSRLARAWISGYQNISTS